MKRWLWRSVIGLGVLFGGLAFIVWLLWIPSAQEPPYGFIQSWGETGTNPGQFRDPTGIAATAKQIFVNDSRNGRIQVFDHQGHFKRQFGSPDEGPDQLECPMNLSIHDNELYVAGFYNQRIQHLNPDGSFIEQWGMTGRIGIQAKAFNYPTDVALGNNGQVFEQSGKFLRKWGGPLGMNIFGPFAG